MRTYILDTNIFIEAWNKYYAPDICPGYWNVILDLARQSKIFIPSEVYEELQDKDDELSKWIKDNKFIIEETDEKTQERIKEILQNDLTKKIVNSNRRRNTADPWVIAHAMANDHVVVTKEILTGRSNDPRIPDVCAHFGVEYINDFDMIRELNITFHINSDEQTKLF